MKLLKLIVLEIAAIPTFMLCFFNIGSPFLYIDRKLDELDRERRRVELEPRK